jgi:hypothetical protein
MCPDIPVLRSQTVSKKVKVWYGKEQVPVSEWVQAWAEESESTWEQEPAGPETE